MLVAFPPPTRLAAASVATTPVATTPVAAAGYGRSAMKRLLLAVLAETGPHKKGLGHPVGRERFATQALALLVAGRQGSGPA